MDKFKFEKLEKAGTYTVLRNNVSILALCTAEAHATLITDALNRAESAANREKWISVNAMSLMFGLQKAAGAHLVHQMQEASGGGFVDGLTEIAPLAIKAAEVELAVFAACEEGFPGVFQYEVTEILGEALARELVKDTLCLQDVLAQRLGDLTYEFMRNSASDPETTAKYAKVIGDVLPEWTAPVTGGVPA
ncbi:hypothetical protein AB4Y45_34000 [Paraburkholderia sp. EG287A]|uniref:hypothetical protein n=1 Tax=Paraburkholderia sp. EG287A TaxID=3237012 RepID=UPI0034D1EA91